MIFYLLHTGVTRVFKLFIFYFVYYCNRVTRDISATRVSNAIKVTSVIWVSWLTRGTRVTSVTRETRVTIVTKLTMVPSAAIWSVRMCFVKFGAFFDQMSGQSLITQLCCPFWCWLELLYNSGKLQSPYPLVGAFTVDKDREARREVGKKERAAYSYTHSKNIYSDYIIRSLTWQREAWWYKY